MEAEMKDFQDLQVAQESEMTADKAGVSKY